jgi:SAM-dependent methyltransferase
MLNVGCGRRFHRAWVNVDLVPMDGSVSKCDISKGLPFDDCHFDAVYHSHVLEHLAPDRGSELIAECFRVLKPGGVIRVVVPDLEQIAKLYLQKHENAWSKNDGAADYQWMKLELLDQLVRPYSGGEMGRYITGGEIKNMAFVENRLGHEMVLCDPEPPSADSRSSVWRASVAKSISDFRHRMARRFVRWMLGSEAVKAFDEGMFRQQGEVHRWMYDRFSLRELFTEAGFENFQVQTAEASEIDDFVNFELDSSNGEIRKPDSIFVEAVKKNASAPAVRLQNKKAA